MTDDTVTTYSNVEAIRWRRDGLIWRATVTCDEAAAIGTIRTCEACEKRPSSRYNARFCAPCREARRHGKSAA